MYLGIDYSSLTLGLVYRDAQDPKVSLCCIIWNKAVLVLSNVTQRSFKTYRNDYNGFVAEVNACKP